MTRRNNVGLEDIFSSRGRVKVLKEILRKGEVNLTQLIQLTGLNYRSVIRHLNFLSMAGLIEEVRVGRTRIYRPRWVNPKVRLLEEIINEFNNSKRGCTI